MTLYDETYTTLKTYTTFYILVIFSKKINMTINNLLLIYKFII